MNGAIFSDDRKYRYVLWRTWDALGMNDKRVMFICLNPSTADEKEDDPTVRRCIGFAKSWGYGGLYMCNLFAFRATEPIEMMKAEDPIGPDNDSWLDDITRETSLIVAGWGEYGTFLDRGKEVLQFIHNVHYLKLNKSGQPAHPLYLKSDLKPIRW